MILNPTNRARLVHVTPIGASPSRTQVELQGLPDWQGPACIEQLVRYDDLFLAGQYETSLGGILLFIEEGAFEAALLIRYYNAYGALEDWAEIRAPYNNFAYRFEAIDGNGIRFDFGNHWHLEIADRPFRRLLPSRYLHMVRVPIGLRQRAFIKLRRL